MEADKTGAEIPGDRDGDRATLLSKTLSTDQCTESNAQLRMMGNNHLGVSVAKYKKLVTTYETYVLFRVVSETNRPEYDSPHFEVDRRYSEFEWLQSRLTQTYPSLFIPPLPGKMLTTALDRFSDNFLSTRAAGIQAFLVRVVSHPILSYDADLLAFLTLSKDDFSKYRTSHPSVGLLTQLLSETRLNFMPGAKLHLDPNQPLQAEEAALGLIGSSSMHNYEEEFRSYTEETNTFLTTARRVASATETIISSLEGLQLGFDELARCLGTWPSQLVVDTGEEIVRQSSLIRDRPTLGDRSSLDWDRKRPVGPEIAGKGASNAAKETSSLAAQLRAGSLADWKEAVAYAQTVREVLSSRENLEKRYFEIVEALKAETAESAQSLMDTKLTVIARNYIPWRQKSLPELVGEANRLQDNLTFSNGQIRAEFYRWQSERRKETIDNLLKMSEAYVNHWTQVARGWQNVAAELETYEPNERVSSFPEEPSHQPDQELLVIPSSKPEDVLDPSMSNIPDFDAVDENEAFLYSSDDSLADSGEDGTR